ncbi:hypothetical protein LY78DRAFT_387271 [Colletotrichum sublineola]|nr:hypothetical protein LY78DRAFT_387271 [Colletotrichum sublineola]
MVTRRSWTGERHLYGFLASPDLFAQQVFRLWFNRRWKSWGLSWYLAAGVTFGETAQNDSSLWKTLIYHAVTRRVIIFATGFLFTEVAAEEVQTPTRLCDVRLNVFPSSPCAYM